MTVPLLTITLPVYNAMPYLPQAVESVLTQTYRDFRFIIIDDGSTDDSFVFLQAIRDARVTVIRQRNLGLGNTLNRLIQLCQTKYFARMDADDVCQPRRLEAQMAFLSANPGVVMLGTQIRLIANDRTVGRPRHPLKHAEIHARLLNGKAGVCHPTIVVETEAARRIGGYRIGGAGEDVDFCLRMCDVGRAANLAQDLYSYRVHARSIGATKQQELQCGYAFARCCAECRARGMVEPKFDRFVHEWRERHWLCRAMDRVDAIAETNYRGGLICLGEGRVVQAFGHLVTAALLRPGAVLRRTVGFMQSGEAVGD